jgi:hypothetical protein
MVATPSQLITGLTTLILIPHVVTSIKNILKFETGQSDP